MKIIELNQKELLLLQRLWYEYTAARDVFSFSLCMEDEKTKQYWEEAITRYIAFGIFRDSILDKYNLTHAHSRFNFNKGWIEVLD